MNEWTKTVETVFKIYFLFHRSETKQAWVNTAIEKWMGWTYTLK